jgi:asparagine synthase (glutamine-hydrolysing)
MSINPYLSYGKNKKKDLLKKLLAQKTTNPPIGNNKRGFSIPLGNWLREDLKEVVWESISSKKFVDNYDINLKELSHMYQLHQENKVDAKWQIFTLYVLAEWKKRMDDFKLI